MDFKKSFQKLYSSFQKQSPTIQGDEYVDRMIKYNMAKSLEEPMDTSQLRPMGVSSAFNINDNAGILFPLAFYDAEKWYSNSSDMQLIIQQIVAETTRTGYSIRPMFVSKCNECGMEYETKVDSCDCGSTDLYTPDKQEKKKLEKLFKKINNGGTGRQTLLKTLNTLILDMNIYNNAYLIAHRTYEYDEDGKVTGAITTGFEPANVKRVEIQMSNDGRYGFSNDGREIILSCPQHRSIRVAKPLDGHKEGMVYKCPVCGKQMWQAYIRYKHDQGDYFYLKDEVLHIKKEDYYAGYGVPIILSLGIKLSILLNQDLYVLALYSLQAPPKGLLVFNAPATTVHKAWKQMLQTKVAHPLGIRPFAIEDFRGVTDNKPLVEWHEFKINSEEVHMENYRTELRRHLGARYGVAPIFMADLSTSGGLNNEGLQLTVTNRAVEKEQATINDVLEWITELLGVTDWYVRLNPNKEKDLMAPEKLNEQKLRVVNMIRQVGYDFSLIQTKDGSLEYQIIGKMPLQPEGVTPQVDSEKDVVAKTPHEENVEAYAQMLEG